MLKFRCPYFKKENSNFIQMLSGEIFIQPWAPHSSTETRLICDAQSGWKVYEIQKYENQMFYHNDEVRIEQKFRFFICIYSHGVKGEGLNSDYDSASDLLQLFAYILKSKKWAGFPLNKRLEFFSQEITKELNCNRTLATLNKPK
jgi:hypothetical protein